MVHVDAVNFLSPTRSKRRRTYTDSKDTECEYNSSNFQGNVICNLIGDTSPIPRSKYVCPGRAYDIVELGLVGAPGRYAATY